jgi:hypothetical protein
VLQQLFPISAVPRVRVLGQEFDVANQMSQSEL